MDEKVVEKVVVPCICVSISILLVASIVISIAWGVIEPTNPSFFIDKASVSADNNLTTTFSIIVGTFNYNDYYWIHYDVVLVSVYHNNGTLLAYQVLPDPLSHHPSTQLNLVAGPVAHNVSLTSDSPLEVRVRADARFRMKGWKKFDGMLKVICSPLAFNFTSSGPDPILCDVTQF